MKQNNNNKCHQLDENTGANQNQWKKIVSLVQPKWTKKNTTLRYSKKTNFNLMNFYYEYTKIRRFTFVNLIA